MTRKVQELIDELERCFYGEESLDKLKKEVAEECFHWRSKFPHYRYMTCRYILEISDNGFVVQNLNTWHCSSSRTLALYFMPVCSF
jgi:hypothetical protein